MERVLGIEFCGTFAFLKLIASIILLLNLRFFEGTLDVVIVGIEVIVEVVNVDVDVVDDVAVEVVSLAAFIVSVAFAVTAAEALSSTDALRVVEQFEYNAEFAVNTIV